MLLEIIVLCGTFTQDEACASLLVQAGLPQFLITRLSGEYILCGCLQFTNTPYSYIISSYSGVLMCFRVYTHL